jgi:hypothetical protein
MVNNVIVKLSYQADQYETAEIRREADKYITAYMEKDSFDSYRSYSMDVLARAGITNLNELVEYSNNRHSIPRDKRKAVLKAMRETVINEYVEMNDYYRELIGMPSVNTPESEWIYLTEGEMKYYEIDEVRPIHEYPKEIQMKLERDLIPRLIELYPERTYLQHMGSKAVNLVRAREAKNFEIIFTDIKLDVVFMRAFFETYDFAREYFMGIIYNKAFRERYDLYDNYMGMHIMIMTVQRLVVDTIKMGIDRDFYDLISIKKLFNVYGVPFFEDLPLDYQRTIVKNVNMLIRCKSTDKVLYDIANTLFYERVRIYKYFLVRERKFDENGEPIYVYKEQVLDEPPEKFYIMSANKKTYELAVQGDTLVTIECNVPYAPESIYMRDEVTDKVYRLYMSDDVLTTEQVEDENQICQSVIMYNEEQDKFKLVIDDDVAETNKTDYNKIKVYDYEKMYDVYFQASDIMEKNVISTLETKYNRYEYDEVVKDDVYWWETEELKAELYGREYTYIDTKYISVTVMQNLTKMLYETVYYLNLLVDHKNTTVPMDQRIFNSDSMKYGTDYLYIDLDRFSTAPVSIFDAVMILCALVSKKNGMKGNIIVKSPSQILSVLGFNFEANFDLIRENIKKYKRTFKNQEIVKYLDLLDIKTVKDIDILYNNFRNFAEFCEEVISTTNDINEYRAYKELYKVFTVRKDTTDLFTLSDGTIAATYMDYLRDKLPYIASTIDEIRKEDTGVYIEHVLGKLNELVPEIEYLNTINGTNNNIVTAIVGLINFFKSYTVDLRNLNVIYMFDNKRMNKIFMIDDPRLLIELFPEESILGYNDILRPRVKFDRFDNLIIYSKPKLFNTIIPKEKLELEHTLQLSVERMDIDDLLELDYKDTMEFINVFGKNDIMKIKTEKGISNILKPNDIYNTEDFITLYNLLIVDDVIDLKYKDVMEFITKFDLTDNIKLNTFKTLSKIILPKDYFVDMFDKLTLSILLRLLDKLELNYKDLIKEISIDFNCKDGMNLETLKTLSNEIVHKYMYDIDDLLMILASLINLLDKLELNYKDVIKEITLECKGNVVMYLNTFKTLTSELLLKDYHVNISDLIYISNLLNLLDTLKLSYKDIINNLDKTCCCNTELLLKAIQHYIVKCSNNDGIYVSESIKLIHED